jgi:hypothetical protein
VAESPPREWWPIYDHCRTWIYNEQRYCGGEVKVDNGRARCTRCGEEYGAVHQDIKARNKLEAPRG